MANHHSDHEAEQIGYSLITVHTIPVNIIANSVMNTDRIQKQARLIIPEAMGTIKIKCMNTVKWLLAKGKNAETNSNIALAYAQQR